MDYTLSLFPFKAKYLGVALMLIALPFAYLYFWGGRPGIFKIGTFAVISAYAETRYFALIETNVLDELAAILFVSGITLFSFSKEKNEKEGYEVLRMKSLVKAVYITILIWLASFILIYGRAIFAISFSIFIVFLMSYNILFRISLFKEKK